MRLSLVKLDSDSVPLGTWMGPGFEGLAADLHPFVQTEEFSADQYQMLVDNLTPARRAA
jgi:hypothetical protein